MKEVIVKKEYCPLEMNILMFEDADVIITSNDTETTPYSTSSGPTSFF